VKLNRRSALAGVAAVAAVPESFAQGVPSVKKETECWTKAIQAPGIEPE
jgi:hypothetical protein